MRAHLKVIAGEARPGDLALTPGTAYELGRSRECAIQIPHDDHASRNHARIVFEHGAWRLYDKSLNGTKRDDQKVNNCCELENGTEIRIGEVVFRFTLPDGLTPQHNSTHRTNEKDRTPPAEPIPVTRVRTDELTALCQFMTTSVEAQDDRELVRTALSCLHQQISANVVGYLSSDPNDVVPKLILPEKGALDGVLSRALNGRIQRDGKTVWLAGDPTITKPMSESLTPFTDAICVPLRAAGQPLGALHAYRHNSNFEERDVRFAEALAGYMAHAIRVLKDRRRLEAENSRLRSHVSADEILGDSTALAGLRGMIDKAAPQPFTVLIQGESGTGKELVALALHRKSARRDGPFVVVNCAAIPSSLIEAELFGYKKNTFTGADRDHSGLFQQADEGTLFLDEIGELPIDCQAKLLRVIEGAGFRPLGSTMEIKPNVRIVAATNRNLETEARTGRFRQDLYYRIKVIELKVPALREHAEDIPTLVEHFLDRLAAHCRRQVRATPAAMRELQGYPWPGNVRQLRAMLESAVVMNCDADTLDADVVRRLLPSSAIMVDAPTSLNWEYLERWSIERALKQSVGNVSQAALIVGVSRDTLYGKIRKWNLRPEKTGTATSDSGVVDGAVAAATVVPNGASTATGPVLPSSSSGG